MAREPGTSFPSETRQLARQDRLKHHGGGPHWAIVIAIAVIVIGAVVYAMSRG